MRFWRKLRGLLPGYRAALERDMQEELESLKAMAAKNELGNLTLVAENARDIWRWGWLDSLWQGIRYSTRTLRKSPGFVVTAVTLLSIGIGLNLAFFQFANAIFLKPVVIRDPGSIVHVAVPAGEDRLDYAAMQVLQANNTMFSAVPAFRAYCPALESAGASTRGDTREPAMKNIQGVLHMIVDEFTGEGKEVPPDSLIASTENPAVLVTV